MTHTGSFSLLFQRLSWYISLIVRFTALKPKCSMLIIALTLASQVLMLASFLLPLKMLFVLAVGDFQPFSIKVLGYFPIHSKEELAVIFGSVIALVLAAYFVVEKLASSRKEKCSADIWKSTQKLQVYADQENIATALYNQYINGLAGFSMFGLVMVVLAFIYPLLLWVFLLYCIVSAVGLSIAYDSSQKVRELVEEGLAQVLNAVFMFGFLVIFIVVVADFISPQPSTQVIFALIAFILLRRTTGSIVAALQSIKQMYNQKHKLTTIFFTEHPEPLSHIGAKEKKFWALFEEGVYSRWIFDALSNITKKQIRIQAIRWMELGIPNEFAFVIECEGGTYLLKIFNKNLHAKALKEATLLSSGDLNDLTLPFVGATLVDEFHCHLFALPEYKVPNPGEFKDQSPKLLKDLTVLKPSSGITKQYRATHKLLHERLTAEILDRAKIAADKSDFQVIQKFEEQFDTIFEHVDTVPLRYMIPGFNAQNTLLVEGHLKLLSVGGWSIEPLGFAFAPHDKAHTADTKLVAALKACEHNCNRHSFKAAIKNMRDILSI